MFHRTPSASPIAERFERDAEIKRTPPPPTGGPFTLSPFVRRAREGSLPAADLTGHSAPRV